MDLQRNGKAAIGDGASTGLGRAGTPVWLRWGRIAVFIACAGLLVVGGMLFAGAPTAEGQGILDGYAYTERVCQELGQQPRHYNVRDEMAGSDWRSDGGWAIVLVRSAVYASGYTFGSVASYATTMPTVEAVALGIGKTPITESNTGRTGFQELDAAGRPYQQWVVIDRDGNGAIDNADRLQRPVPPNDLVWEKRRWSTWVNNYGAIYIRWANMLWCR